MISLIYGYGFADDWITEIFQGRIHAIHVIYGVVIQAPVDLGLRNIQ
jgi:hypothetical protein